MPGLFKAALTDSPYDRRPALRLAEDMWSERKELVWNMKEVIPKALKAGLAHPSGSRYRILADLTALVKDDGTKSKLPLYYAFGWDDTGDMVQDVFPVVLDDILTAAVHDEEHCGMAQTLLQMLVKNGEPRVQRNT